MLEDLKTETAFERRKAEKMRLQMLSEKNEETKKLLEEKVAEVLSKANAIKKQQKNAKETTIAMQKQLEKQAQDLMEKQRKSPKQAKTLEARQKRTEG